MWNGEKLICPLINFPFHSLRQLPVLPRFSAAAVRPAVRWFVIVKILVRFNHPAGFKTQHFQTLAGKGVRGHAARSARSHYDHVVNSLCRQTKFLSLPAR